MIYAMGIHTSETKEVEPGDWKLALEQMETRNWKLEAGSWKLDAGN